MITYAQAIAEQPLVCHQGCCGYPHPHCTWCTGPLLWDSDKSLWQHTNDCPQLIWDWQPHAARTLADDPSAG